jgi:hypothetical protein
MQGGERTGQPEQDRHGHLRQLQLQVQVSEFETTAQRGQLNASSIDNFTYNYSGGDHWSCVWLCFIDI